MKRFYILPIAFVFALLMTRESLACVFCVDEKIPFSEFQVVGKLGAESWSGPKTADGTPIFGFNETPYLYVKVPQVPIWTTVETDWMSPLGVSYPKDTTLVASWDTLFHPDQTKKAWIYFSNWNDIRKVGKWDISGSYSALFCQTGIGQTSLVVTPEPTSIALFGIGGAAMAFKRWRRKV